MALSDLQESVLIDLIIHGPNTPTNIGDNIGRPGSSISRVLPELLEDGLVHKKGSGVYRLTDTGLDIGQSLLRQRIEIYS